MRLEGRVYRIERVTADRIGPLLDRLSDLLCDAVASGASVGFLEPLARTEARAYWEGARPALAAGERILLVALEGDNLLGSVQLALEGRANGRHRAEVLKLLVSRGARRRGIGSALIRAAEGAACERGRTLLVLDTLRGDEAERLYARLGFTRAGVIPRYAADPFGVLADTVYMYRELTPAPSGQPGTGDE